MRRSAGLFLPFAGKIMLSLKQIGVANRSSNISPSPANCQIALDMTGTLMELSIEDGCIFYGYRHMTDDIKECSTSMQSCTHSKFNKVGYTANR